MDKDQIQKILTCKPFPIPEHWEITYGKDGDFLVGCAYDPENAICYIFEDVKYFDDITDKMLEAYGEKQ